MRNRIRSLVPGLGAALVVAICAATDPSAFAQQDGGGRPPAVKSVYFRAAVFFLPDPLADPEEVARKTLGRKFAGRMRQKTDPSPVSSGVHVAWKRVSTEDYPVPDREVLAWKGLGITDEALERLGRSEEVMVVEFLAADPRDYDYIGWSNRFLYELARRTGGCVWDNETRQMFSVEVWKERRIEAPARDLAIANTTIQGHPEAERVRAITLGMRKFGHPDFSVAGFSRGNWLPMGDLLYFLMNESVRAGPFRARNAYPAEELREKLNFPEGSLVPPLALIRADPQPGDPENLVLTIDWSVYPGESLPDKQRYLVENLLVPDPKMRVIREHQRELLVLSALAREKLADKRTQFHKGLDEGEEIRVKAWHRGEYVWMRIAGWEGDRLRCVLTADSSRSRDHKQGDTVVITLDDVFDYVHVFPDGRMEGDDTGAAIQALLEREKQIEGEDAPGSGPEKK